MCRWRDYLELNLVNKKHKQKKMQEEINIINKLWDFIEEEKGQTKIAQKAYNWLNKDNLSSVMIFNSTKRFYFELTTSYTEMPNYIFSYLKRWATKQGYIYLYS